MVLVFSYGDLRKAEIQISIVGRRLRGREDELLGCEIVDLWIQDPQVVEATGKTHHRDLRFDGSDTKSVEGVVFEVTPEELARIDAFEARFDYGRVTGQLASGDQAWVYVHRSSVPT
jgi:gamma-glutamylcyclotransferase (GGCT)/AIG2-like uncharacterized protein YtfP